jgi:hypothetical protein
MPAQSRRQGGDLVPADGVVIEQGRQTHPLPQGHGTGWRFELGIIPCIAQGDRQGPGVLQGGLQQGRTILWDCEADL